MTNDDRFARKETSFEGRQLPIEKAGIKHPEVISFAILMDDILTKNDYKGGWQDCKIQYLRARLVEELGEYFARVAINIDYESTKPLDARDKELERKELVDIANFAMMLWDRA